MAGNFSNGGVDTFDADKGYVGIRLQQGVPLLDRDWNELEDIRRHVEAMLRTHYVGDGVPDVEGFVISSPPGNAEHELIIGPGRCSVGGFDVVNRVPVAYSTQGEQIQLPEATGADPVNLTVYLEPAVLRIGESDDPDLANAQDVNVETCVRDRLDWAVKVVRFPDVPPPGTYALAQVIREADEDVVRRKDISDLRRTRLSLATTVDRMDSAEAQAAGLKKLLQETRSQLDAVKRDLDRLFWEVQVQPTRTDALFGDRVPVSVTVRTRGGEPVPGAVAAFSTDWGTVEPALVTTDARGIATVDLIGVRHDVPVHIEDLAILERVSTKVSSAMVTSTNAVANSFKASAIEHAKVVFDPMELGLISKYSPTGALVDLTNDLPRSLLPLIPHVLVANLTVHIKESAAESIVKATGNVQVSFLQWVRDWARTKVWEMTEQLQVGARVGDLVRLGVVEAAPFDATLVEARLPDTLVNIALDAQLVMKEKVFGDPGLGDDGLRGSGKLGQVIVEETTAAIGAKTQRAFAAQFATLVATTDMDEATAATAQLQLNQGSAQIVAGLAQTQRQQFARVEG
jgi:hypothetical protein